ncbi:hypothetical protein BN1723_020314, partial [Verticillium longisporum]
SQGHKCSLTGANNSDCPLAFEIEEADLPLEDDYLCSYCKAFSYLSRFKCTKTGKILCLLHAGQHACCDVPESQRYL